MITVTVTPFDLEPIARALLPQASVGVGFDCVYRLHSTADCVEPVSFADVDGAALVEVHTFPTVEQARRWCEEHERQRRLLHSAGGRQ